MVEFALFPHPPPPPYCEVHAYKHPPNPNRLGAPGIRRTHWDVPPSGKSPRVLSRDHDRGYYKCL